jgi:phosphoglycerate dehydrogenase-like enzyme
MVNVLCTDPLPQALIKTCENKLPDGAIFEVVPDGELSTFASMAGDAEILIVAHRRIDAELLANAPKVRFIQRAGLGHENIIVKDTNAAGIPAAYTPGANAGAVAEHTIMHMLIAARRFADGERAARANTFPNLEMAAEGIGDIAGATIGFIGMGYSGQAVAERLIAFGPQMIYYKRNRLDLATEQRLHLSYVSLSELLARSKIVSLHTPLTEETHHMIGDEELAAMQQGSFLINVSRGGLIDEGALRRAIESGHLAGAGLDTVQKEEAGGNPFTDLPQVLVTPHTAGPSKRGLDAILERTFANVERVMKGNDPIDLVPGSQLSPT